MITVGSVLALQIGLHERGKAGAEAQGGTNRQRLPGKNRAKPCWLFRWSTNHAIVRREVIKVIRLLTLKGKH